ncbi:MAG: S8 family serine peptidase [Nitrospirae bacterium]|nr:S8 family serine peptidase [Nitrospirota bacterium]
MKSLNFFIVILAASFFTSACGGGGGGGSSSANTVTQPEGYTVSGAVNASAGSAVDSDVNDPGAPYSSNDNFDSAQAISNPVTLGGYVNVAGLGPAGRSYESGDVSDFFKVTLAAGQTITLIIASHAAADLDMYLYNEAQAPVDSSQNTTQTESLTVALQGDYYIEVRAFNGASNYTLSIGQGGPLLAAGTPSLSDEFVPGELIVKFKDQMLSKGNAAGTQASVQSLGLVHKQGERGRAMLMSIGDEQQRQAAFKTPGIKRSEGVSAVTDNEIKRKKDTLEIIKALRKRPDILYAEPNYIRRAYAVPDDTYYSRQWHYSLINLPSAWNITTGSSNVTVGVIDTGILLNHPDLQGQVAGDGYDFISDPAMSLDGDGIDSSPADPGDQSNLNGSSSFHGTHVAGTIAALSNNATGVAGIAWGVKIMPLRVLGKSGGTSFDIQQAVLYAAGLSNASGTVPVKKADIINLSLGGGGASQSEQEVFTQARNAGVIIVAAAGNENSSTPSYPASYDGVVSVSAVTIDKSRAYYSNFNLSVDIAAPGGDTRSDNNGDGYPDGVLSTRGDDLQNPFQYTYEFLQGTSMASPHVAGVAALMKSVNSGLTPPQFDSLLAGGQLTEDLGEPGKDNQFGYGLINAYKAVGAAGNIPLAPVLVVNPASLNFSTSLDRVILLVENAGGGTLVVNGLSDDAVWLTVSELSVDANKQGAYNITVNRSGLPDGTYTASITVASSVNPVTVPVIMQVSNTGAATNAGHHYVLLLDPDTNATVKEAEASADNGVYNYAFTGVTGNTYRILAGTDFDNDGFICDTGEACGSYLTLDQPVSVTVNGSLTGLDFSTGFNPVYSVLSSSGMRRNVSKQIKR